MKDPYYYYDSGVIRVAELLNVMPGRHLISNVQQLRPLFFQDIGTLFKNIPVIACEFGCFIIFFAVFA